MRRRLALFLFVAIVALCIDRSLLKTVALRYPQLTKSRADPRGFHPEYPSFLEEVRARTKSGDTIAIVVPTRDWDAGYEYAYYRASYLLPGREVLPVRTPAGAIVTTNVTGAKYLAVWRMRPSGTRPVVWRGHGGVLEGPR